MKHPPNCSKSQQEMNNTNLNAAGPRSGLGIASNPAADSGARCPSVTLTP